METQQDKKVAMAKKADRKPEIIQKQKENYKKKEQLEKDSIKRNKERDSENLKDIADNSVLRKVAQGAKANLDLEIAKAEAKAAQTQDQKIEAQDKAKEAQEKIKKEL